MTEVLLHNPIETTDQTLPSFEKVYSEHFRNIVGYLYRRSGNYRLAEDLAQDVFLKLFDKYTNVEGAITNIRDPEKTARFLRRVASRVLIDHQRTKRNRSMDDIGELLDLPERVSTDPAKLAIIGEGVRERNSMVKILKVGMRSLDLKQRQVLEKSFISGQDDQKIAEDLGVPWGTVKSRKSRGKKALVRRVFPRGISTYNLPDSLREVGDYPF